MTVTANTQRIASSILGSVEKLKSILRPVRRVLTFSLADDAIAPSRNVSVSISKGSVSVAYGTRALSRIRVRGVKTYPMDDKYPSPEALASSVSMALNGLRASKADITLCIPKAWAIIKSVEFPSTVRDNLPDVVSYEMDRLTPFTREEALYDFRILKEDAGRLSLVVVAAKADLINPYIHALRERGCAVTRVTLNLSGLSSLCSFSHRCDNVVFLRIGEKEYEAALFAGGLVTVARAGGLGGDEKTQLDIISGEIDLLMEEGRKKGISPQMVLSLRGAAPSLREMLKLRINTPFKILEEGGAALGLASQDISFDAAGGVLESLWPKANGLNLLRKGIREKTETPFTLSIILVLAILAIWAISIFIPVSVEEKKLEAIRGAIAARKEEIRKVEALKKEIEGLNKEISVISDFKSARPMTLDLMKELTITVPKKTWLSRMRITQTTVELEGYATSATELLPKLEASKYFKKAEFASPTFRDVRMNLERFNIKMEIEGAKKIEATETEETKRASTTPAKAPTAPATPKASTVPMPAKAATPAPAKAGKVGK